MLNTDSDNLQTAIQDCLDYINGSELKSDATLSRLIRQIQLHSVEVENPASTILRSFAKSR